MRTQNIFFVAARSLFFDIIWDIAYFPIWWYTVGLKHIVVNRFRSIRDMFENLAIRLLILNIFKPMFAQYDRAGRIISFFMRIIILVARLIYFIVFVILEIAVLIVWVALPIFVTYRLIITYAYFYAGP